MPTSACPKCGGSMEPGFVVDHADHGAVAKSKWAAGEPRFSRWLGMRMEGRQQYDVKTERCTRCGFLESYANEPEAGSTF